uniref:Aquaporin-4-like n=1 Tax=Drosophila rhopaloa TaxID=1041015 RepID=A0A6P4FR84_DRORH
MLSFKSAIAYFVAQAAGALIGYGLLVAVLPQSSIKGVDDPAGACVTVLASDISEVQGVFIEFLITCCLVMVACSVWDPRNVKLQDSVAVRFGLAVSCLILTAGQMTGASMNPARSFAPAIWNGVWANHWIYWVGPMAGALVTSLIYKHAFRREVEDSEVDEATMSTKRTSEAELA